MANVFFNYTSDRYINLTHVGRAFYDDIGLTITIEIVGGSPIVCRYDSVEAYNQAKEHILTATVDGGSAPIENKEYILGQIYFTLGTIMPNGDSNKLILHSTTEIQDNILVFK